MADRMRVTSVIDDTTRANDAAEQPLPTLGQSREALPSGCVQLHDARAFPQSRREWMSIPPAWPLVPDFFGTPLVMEPSPDQLSSDAGRLPIRPFDERSGFTGAFAEALDDPRDPDL